MENLLRPYHPTHEKAHAQAEQQIRQYAPQDRGANNIQITLHRLRVISILIRPLHQHHKQNNLHYTPQRRL